MLVISKVWLCITLTLNLWQELKIAEKLVTCFSPSSLGEDVNFLYSRQHVPGQWRGSVFLVTHRPPASSCWSDTSRAAAGPDPQPRGARSSGGFALVVWGWTDGGGGQNGGRLSKEYKYYCESPCKVMVSNYKPQLHLASSLGAAAPTSTEWAAGEGASPRHPADPDGCLEPGIV